MKILYIECNMGAAGDMLMAALYELSEKKEEFIAKMNNLGLPGVRVKRYIAQTCGITGSHMSVRIGGTEEGYEHTHSSRHRHTHSHSHTKPENISAILSALPVSPWVKQKAQEVYDVIAEAESKAHGKPVNEIHFHEVGQLDAVADITGVCMLMEEIAVDKIVVSPIATGSGTIKTAHGRLPVPAPATANILQGIPCVNGGIEDELCTPTGAALLKVFADSFGEMPPMITEKSGIGIGRKNFDKANCVRVFLGESMDKHMTETESGETVELKANIDDMTPEMLSAAAEVLMSEGAADVYTVPIFMKKNRQAVMLCCICPSAEAERFAALILKHTTTIGVRCNALTRYTLSSVTEKINTKYGEVRVKRSAGFGTEKSKIEYEDIYRISKETGLPSYKIAAELENIK